jgi:ribonuclease R
MLRMFAFQKGADKEKKLYASLMPSLGEKTSAQERKALELERDVISMHKAQIMASKIGETFKGIITSVVPFGLYITLENAIEGLLHISTLETYYVYDEKTLTLKSLESDQAFKLGDEVVVQCKKVNVFEGEIDLVLGATS